MAGEYSELQNLEIVLQDIEAKPCALPLKLLRNITSDFSDKKELGRGGSGVVYKGVLGNGQLVAVKRFMFMPGGVDNRQFENEVQHLVMLRHPNIVRFLGYCSETRELFKEHEGKRLWVETQDRLLCLEYMVEGSLKKHISDESCGLDWHTRYKIIKGICRGLHYLHEESQTNTPTMHLDLKPDNILLSNEMEPKITDFGLSRLFGEDQTRTCTTSITGTLGYMAPEYINKGIISKKSDIFGLGVILIEIITGGKNYPSRTGESQLDFVEEVLGKWRKHLEGLRYKSLENDCQQIETCIQIGLKCVQTDADQRPTTKEIIENLKDSMYMHGIKQEWSPVTGQVLQNWVNSSQTGIFPRSDLQSSDHQTSLNVELRILNILWRYGVRDTSIQSSDHQTSLNADAPGHTVPVENVPSKNSFPAEEPPPHLDAARKLRIRNILPPHLDAASELRILSILRRYGVRDTSSLEHD